MDAYARRVTLVMVFPVNHVLSHPCVIAKLVTTDWQLMGAQSALITAFPGRKRWLFRIVNAKLDFGWIRTQDHAFHVLKIRILSMVRRAQMSVNVFLDFT